MDEYLLWVRALCVIQRCDSTHCVLMVRSMAASVFTMLFGGGGIWFTTTTKSRQEFMRMNSDLSEAPIFKVNLHDDVLSDWTSHKEGLHLDPDNNNGGNGLDFASASARHTVAVQSTTPPKTHGGYDGNGVLLGSSGGDDGEHHPQPLGHNCDFGDMQNTFVGTCSHFTINRIGSRVQMSMDRARTCALQAGVQCILSPEIGLSIPAAFVADATGVMNMIIAPKMVHEEVGIPQQVRVFSPKRTHQTNILGSSKTFVFNSSIKIEYLDSVSKKMVQTRLDGHDAHCVQLLRKAFDESCWNSLD